MPWAKLWSFIKDNWAFVFGTLGLGAYFSVAWETFLGCRGCVLWIGVPAVLLGLGFGVGSTQLWQRRHGRPNRGFVLIPVSSKCRWTDGKEGDEAVVHLYAEIRATNFGDRRIGFDECHLFKPVAAEMRIIPPPERGDQGACIVGAGEMVVFTTWGHILLSRMRRPSGDIKAKVRLRDVAGHKTKINIVFKAPRPPKAPPPAAAV